MADRLQVWLAFRLINLGAVLLFCRARRAAAWCLGHAFELAARALQRRNARAAP